MKNYLLSILFAIFFLFSFVAANAQVNSDLIENSENILPDDGVSFIQFTSNDIHLKKNENAIQLIGEAYNHSTSIPFAFTKTILQNGFISDDLKNDVTKHLKDFNYHEFGYNAGLRWTHRWSDSSFFKGTTTSVALKQRYINQMRFTKDAFNLVFFGNAMYAGDSAILDGSRYSGIKFRQVQFGWLKKFGSADSSRSLFAGASLLQGMSARYASVGKGHLFTEMNGEFVDLNSAFVYLRTDTSASNTFSFNGIGASVDVVLSFPIGQKGNFKFYLNDAGFIHWNNKSIRYTQDSSIHFEGLQVNNLFSFQDSSFLKINTDTILKTTGVQSTHKGFSTSLPMVISMVYGRSILNSNAVVKFGIQYKPSVNVLPLVFVSFTSFKPKFVYPSLMISAGGLDGFSAGVGLSKIIANRFLISVGAESALGLMVPHTFTSAAAFARVNMRF